MLEKADINQEMLTARLEAKIEPSNDKFEVLRGTLVSWMDIHQARTETTNER
jgi:hypothetical protein